MRSVEYMNGRAIPKVVLMIESSRATGRALLRGIANYAHDHEPWSFTWEPRGLEKSRSRLRNLRADGFILRDVENVEEVLKRGLPTVIVEHSRHEIPGHVNVVTDSATIGQLAASHLLRCGFRHFAFCGYAETPWSEQRRLSFTELIQKSGSDVRTYIMGHSKGDAKRPLGALQRWLEAQAKPLGVMACNDEMALRVIEACHLAGIKVPDDVAVVGADNDEVVCGLADPPLSSVAIDFERAGYESASVLSQMMQGHKKIPPRIVVAASHVVPRRSTDVVAVEDTSLAKALGYIRAHARQTTSVSEAAKAAGLSRRALEKRFRMILHRSALTEIRQVRADQMARLLVETDLSVTQIAEATGFDDVRHFARYFQAIKKMTPLVFRRSFTKPSPILPGLKPDFS